MLVTDPIEPLKWSWKSARVVIALALFHQEPFHRPVDVSYQSCCIALDASTAYSTYWACVPRRLRGFRENIFLALFIIERSFVGRHDERGSTAKKIARMEVEVTIAIT